MKKIVFFNCIVLCFGFLFFNFQKAPSPPVNVIVDFNLEEFVYCANNGAGEAIELSGSLHILLVSNINNQRISGSSHFQPQGVQGRGLSTGNLYKDRKSTRLNSSHSQISYAVFCLKKK